MLLGMSDPQTVAVAATTGMQAVAAATCYWMSRRTVAARVRKENAELRARLERANKTIETLAQGCGQRMWAVYTRGTEFEKAFPRPAKPKEGGKGKDKRRGKHAVAAAAAFIVGVII